MQSSNPQGYANTQGILMDNLFLTKIHMGQLCFYGQLGKSTKNDHDRLWGRLVVLALDRHCINEHSRSIKQNMHRITNPLQSFYSIIVKITIGDGFLMMYKQIIHHCNNHPQCGFSALCFSLCFFSPVSPILFYRDSKMRR